MTNKMRHLKLPSAESYYRQHFSTLKMLRHTDWVSVSCCFHDDSHPSLRINLVTGAFRCFACGARGGNIIAFHTHRYEMSLIDTINYFGARGHI